MKKVFNYFEDRNYVINLVFDLLLGRKSFLLQILSNNIIFLKFMEFFLCKCNDSPIKSYLCSMIFR